MKNSTHRFTKSTGTVALLGALATFACAVAPDTTENVGATSQELASGFQQEIPHHFDGSDDRVTIPSHAAYALGSGDFTFEVQARVDASSGFLTPLLSRRTGSADGFYFTLYGNQLLLQLSGVPNYLSGVLPDVKDGNFHTFAVTRSGTTVTFYVDGVSVGSTTSARSINSAGPVNVGFDSVDGAGLRGEIRFVRLWKVARSAAEIEEKKASSVATDAPGLIGNFGVSLGGGETVMDQSPIGNHAFLGTDAYAIDGANPIVFVPEVVRVRDPSPPNARTTGSNASGDSCADILVDGTMEYFNISDYTLFREETKAWFCDKSKIESLAANNGSVGLDIEIEGLPIHVGANWENTASYNSYNDFCSDNSKTLDYETARHWVYNLASPDIVSAWLDCMELNGTDGANLVASHTLSSDSTGVVLSARKALAVGQVDPIVTGFSYTGMTCSGTFASGSTLGYAVSSLSCVRQGNAAIFAVLTTNQGTLTWDLPALGPIGSAYATASVPVSTTNFVQRDCGATAWVTPSCRNSGFLGLGKKECPRTRGTATVVTGVAGGELRNVTATCSGDCGESSVDAIRKPTPASAIVDFYVPSSTKKYKKNDIPTAGYRLCGNTYKTTTTNTAQNSTTVTVYRGQPFVVSVPANASQPILLLTVGTSQMSIDLSMPGTRNGVTVAIGASNSTIKTYTVTVN